MSEYHTIIIIPDPEETRKLTKAIRKHFIDTGGNPEDQIYDPDISANNTTVAGKFVLRLLEELTSSSIPPDIIKVFGSIAKGSSTQYSDIDVLCVYRDHINRAKGHQHLSSLSWGFMELMLDGLPRVSGFPRGVDIVFAGTNPKEGLPEPPYEVLVFRNPTSRCNHFG